MLSVIQQQSLPLFKAYIPLRRKTTGIGALHWVTPPTRPIPTCWYLKTLKFALPPMQILKLALAPTQNPNVSQWNIGCVGYQTQSFRVGHVHFMLFVLISFAFGGQRKPSFQWNMGLSLWYDLKSEISIYITERLMQR